MPAFTVGELAEICAGSVDGDAAKIISGANSLNEAGPLDLSFVSNKKTEMQAVESRAGCLVVGESFNTNGDWALIRVFDPRTAFARALTALYPAKRDTGLIHPTVVIAPSAKIGPGCSIGPYCVVGEETIIGPNCRLGDGCSIGSGVKLGNDCRLHPRVTIYDGVSVGSRVILHAGCVLGADGFGFTLAGDHYEKFPQVGSVEIGDDVEIGANCCVDRAALGVTRIATGAKLDNLVHVGHNCSIGKHVLIAAQTGFSGSVTVGDFAAIGGQVGIGEKATIAAKAIVGGKAGILTSQTVRAGEPVWGIPARPLRQHLKGLAQVNKLSELREEVRQVRRKFDELERKQTSGA